MIEKTTRMNFLFDFYQALLTDKQRSYMQLYYLDDLSLGEIAEEYSISRQAVYDNIRRTEAMLEEYEDKLNLLTKFEKRQETIEQLLLLVKDQSSEKTLIQLINQLKEWD
ncbi:putative DNA-binding protein [Psychrobacillus sp. FSL H8-0484]|uniref:putative DNA-binding protein n=1 Tax=Psychrobacillus sp. FSL H8-0484 TaxID=2921390 RepID=UPI0030F5A8B2